MYGHKQGVDTVKSVVEASGEIGLKYLTLYTFSIENWNRPRAEVDALMGLMTDAIIRNARIDAAESAGESDREYR